MLALWRTGVGLLVLAVAGLSGSMEVIAAARTAVTFLFIPGAVFALNRVLPVDNRAVAARLWRPGLASALMALAVYTLHRDDIDVAAVRLIVDAATGAVSYTAALMALWWLSGRPAGPEASVVASVWAALRGWRMAP
jgi:PST family polysaccharide transporter